MLNTVLASLSAVALLATAGPAGADESLWNGGPWKVGAAQIVRVDGLDLARAEDRGRLLAAIETAAERACRDVRTRGARETCKADAMDAALACAPRARAAVELALAERDGARVALGR